MNGRPGAELRHEGKARAQLGAAGAGAAHMRSREILARDGDPMACDGAPMPEPHPELALDGSTGPAAAPPPSCAALLRVEAVPLADEPARVPIADAPANEGPVPTLARARPYPRALDRGAAWRGTAIAAGVASGASLGGILGGIVLLFQSDSQPVWEDLSPENARKKEIGTGMLIGSSIGFVAFGALALGASAAAERVQTRHYARFAPTLDRHAAGLGMRVRFYLVEARREARGTASISGNRATRRSCDRERLGEPNAQATEHDGRFGYPRPRPSC